MSSAPHALERFSEQRFLRILPAIGLAALGLLSNAANAVDFSFTGEFNSDNDVALFDFAVGAESEVVLRTYSYAGGVNAEGRTIPPGGFDPILAVFDSTGALIDDNDDDIDCLFVAEDPVTGNCWDTYLAVRLPAGSYQVAVTQFSNFANGPNLSNGFEGTETTNFDERGNNWAFDILNVDQAENISPSPVPEDVTELEGGFVQCASDSDPSSVTNRDTKRASCSAFGDTVAAVADVGDASVKLRGNDSVTSTPAAFGYVFDLITITEGFDADGRSSGTFQVDVEGMIDTSDAFNATGTQFEVLLWYPGQSVPFCVFDPNDFECSGATGSIDGAGVFFDLFDGRFDSDTFFNSGGSGEINSNNPDDLRATLTVPWSVTRDDPSFYVVVTGDAFVSGQGAFDFFNTAKASFTGPPGFIYAGKQAFGRERLPQAESPTAPVNLSGNILNGGGDDLCALVLASGRFQFSCEPTDRGAYGNSLQGLPREPNGSVRRQVYAAGFKPRVEDLQGSVNEAVLLESAGQCPDFNPPSMPVSRPDQAGQRHSLSGQVLLANGDTPLTALVLINGQFVFSINGNYSVDFVLDQNGQFTRQVYASGFAPSIMTFDQSTTNSTVRLTNSNLCE